MRLRFSDPPSDQSARPGTIAGSPSFFGPPQLCAPALARPRRFQVEHVLETPAEAPRAEVPVLSERQRLLLEDELDMLDA